MKKIQGFLFALALALAGFSAGLRAEDIDIYVDNASTAGVPNVLFVIDNGANFSANAKIGCAAYGGTTEPPSLGTSTGAGILQCALVDAIGSLPDGSMNIGVLVSNGNDFANDVRAPGDRAYHETCPSDLGGCLVRKLTLMTATDKASLVRFIKSWTDNGQNDANRFNVKVNTALPGSMMQEAWAYFNGKTGMSGMSYPTSLLGTGCQKNFIIYIANTEKEPATGESPSPFDGANGLTSAQVGATEDQRREIFESVAFNPATCQVTSMAPGTSASSWNKNWADEWARLMYEQDGGAGDAEGSQNIITYTVGITNDQTCTAAYSALLTTMAKYGRGKHFKSSNVSELLTALATILNEVQAVNSVFSSASLPVSVNAEGSFLNQIFLGMFRPDATAAPRWMGNLKQYKLVRSSAGNLVMGDADGNPAISSAGTGFLSPTAVSLWTSKDTTTAPDNLGGFFVNDPKGTPKGPFDKPDGEVVEKGGVAQQLRLASLTSTFSGAGNTSSNPRRLYTYCPAGTSCVSSLTDPANDFSTANAAIAFNAFGSATSVPIASIVRTGTNALVTTSGNHGFTSGSTITISNATQTEYNVTQTLTATTVNGSTTFTITGLPDYPTTPSQGTYTIATVSGTSMPIASMSRSSNDTSTANEELVTVRTAAVHGFTTASDIVITGATPPQFNFSGRPESASGDTLTFRIAIEPPASNANSYHVTLSPTANPPLTYVELTNPAAGQINGDTKGGSHNLHAGQTIKISGLPNGSKYGGTFTIASVPTPTTFTITGLGNSVDKLGGAFGTIEPDTTTATTIVAGNIARTGTAATGTATITGLTSSKFGAVAGDTKVVRISKSGGTAVNEDAFTDGNRDVTITCKNTGCTSASYKVVISPAVTAAGAGMTVSPAGVGSVNVPAGSITRSGTTATVGNLTANLFGVAVGATKEVSISAVGTALSSESDYLGKWTITCANASCTSATFGPVALTPATPATGTNMQVYSGSTPPDRDTVVKWVRGMDNQGDEKGPGSTVTVRQSIHGDVLHSRPLVVNYGDSRGIVVFYGSNDGVFRAINGNETDAIGSVPAGGELWGLVLPEHYTLLNRLRVNSPELKLPESFLSTARPKNYFVDGPTGAYQTLKADGTIDKAVLYLTMRRGGRFLYAVDVSTPTDPKVLWRISSDDVGFEELGQTWSRPRLTVLQDLNDASDPPRPVPVLVFGAGYDTAQDSEPPAADTMGRGLFVINARTGALIWSASRSCSAALATCRNVPEMNWSIPSEIGFVDRDGNGRTDKFYFGDMGGNLWRADVAGAVSTWKVTRVAQLGCESGVCASGTTPRKFFYPPSVLSVHKAGEVGSYEMLSISSGDREHPLRNLATGSSYNVKDRFFMVKDLGTTVGAPVGAPSTQNVVPNDLENIASELYVDASSKKGFYVGFATGEKGVNAPLAVNGQIFFATNRPVDRSKTCAANLGEAKAYAVSPFDGSRASNVLAGGGMPPSAVTGIINIVSRNADGTTTTSQEKFCIGCGLPGKDPSQEPPCNSALENCNVGKSIPKNLRRTYWYKK